MRFLSVCSGIEAASVAWMPLGWEAFALSEIEAFPSAVLDYHYPDVPNLGDMEAFHEWPDANVDVLVGGTPCQSFSVAGMRRGLDDPRGNLTLTYLAVAERYRPEWLVWENVPGVLSSDGGRAFGAFLGGLEKLGYGWAYRTLDAQYFHLAQGRRRVFSVASARGWTAAGSVLFEPDSMRWGFAPSRNESEVSAFYPSSGGDSRGLDARPVTLALHSQNVAFATKDWARWATPRECERLQGFPDDYTLIPYRGAWAKDGPRYKALGNSMAVPVIRWIGERMAAVDAEVAA